ncbi:MAG: YkgJ family cysteine cluster protein [Methanothrix sp.]|nr:YkgJ family cysteine cluster protein [Methanothrix sp.]
MKSDANSSSDRISQARRLCHQHCLSSCVEDKRQGRHVELLRLRPHWSVLKKEEQIAKIDQGERIPFDISLPLPARDEREGSDAGIGLFWERFRCQQCGRCCYTPGAGLYLEQEDFDRIAGRVGKKKLRALCRHEKALNAWILKQPCPFYDRDKGCSIYEIRPLTCTKYPLHPPLQEMPYNLAVDAFCPAARVLAKDTLGWWIICENNWAAMLHKLARDQGKKP